MMAFVMHAFLIVGASQAAIESRLQKLVKKLRAKALPFPLAKIEDVRRLDAFANLRVPAPSVIIVKNIEKATAAAQNAFLKNLEEPQKNLYYILTAVSTSAPLPTITSRCQIVRSTPESRMPSSLRQTVEFLKMDPAARLSEVEKIRGRDEALVFCETLISNGHHLLLKTQKKHYFLAKFLKVALMTSKRLKANGNVALQLTNMVIKLS